MASKTPGHILPLSDFDKEFIREAFNAADLGIWKWDIGADKVTWSENVLSIFGIREEQFDFTYSGFLSFVPEADREYVQNTIDSCLQNRSPGYYLEHRIVRADNSTRWLETHGKLQLDEEGRPRTLLGTVCDVTARKAAQEELAASENRLRTLIDAGSDAIACFEMKPPFDPEQPQRRQKSALAGAVLSEFNDRFSALLGMDRARLYGSRLEKLVPLFKDMHEDFIGRLVEKRYALEEREIYIAGKKKSGYFNVTITPVFSGTKLQRLWISFYDTGEQHKILSRLRAKDELLRHVISDVDSGVLLLSANARFIQYNDRALQLLGLSREAIAGRSYEELHPTLRDDQDHDLPLSWHAPTKALKTGKDTRQTVAVISEKEPRWLIISAKPWKDASGGIEHVVCTLTDITALKKAELALKESEHLFSQAFMSSPDGISITSFPEGIFYKVNDSFLRITGYGREELIGKTTREVNIWSDPERRSEMMEKLQQDGHLHNFKAFLNTRQQGQVMCELSIETIRLSGKPYLLATIKDITDRYLAQLRLEEQRNFNQAILDTAGVLIVVLDHEGRVVRFNKYCHTVTGFSVEELRGKKFWEYLIPEKDKAAMRDSFYRLVTQKLTSHDTNVWLDVQGTAHHIAWSNSCIMDDDNQVKYVVSIGRDISDLMRNAHEQKLMAQMVEELNSATDLDTMARIMSAKCAALFGYDAFSFEVFDEERRVRYPILTLDIMEGENKPRVVRNEIELSLPKTLEQVFRGKGKLVNRKAGEESKKADLNPFGSGRRSLSLLFASVRDKDDCLGILSVQSYRENRYGNRELNLLQMIADHSSTAMRRIIAQEELEKSQEHYRRLSEATSEGILFHKNGKIVDANSALCQMSGYSLEELIGSSAFMLVAKKDRPFVSQYIAENREGTIEVTGIHKSGRKIPLEINGRSTHNGASGMRIVAVRDISERKKAEEDLRLSEQKFRVIFNQAFQYIGLLSAEGSIISMNETVFAQSGLGAGEIEGKPLWELSWWRDKAAAGKKLRQAIRALGDKENLQRFDLEAVSAAGTPQIVDISLKRVTAEPGHVKYVIFEGRDITDIRKAEESLRKQSRILRQTGSLALVGGWEVDLQTQAFLWTQQTYQIHDVDETFVPTFKSLKPFYKALNLGAIDDIVDDLRQLSGSFNFSVPMTTAKGTKKWVRVIGDLERRNDRAVKAFGAIQDITRQKEYEEELTAYRYNLERLVEERTGELKTAQEALISSEKMATLGRLTGVVSHELRNPLGTIRSSLYTIREKARKSNVDIERPLSRAERNIVRCDLIIEELLEYTRARELTTEKADLSEWLQSFLDEHAVPEGVNLNRSISEGVRVEFDKERLRRCMINLIDNACQAILVARNAGTKDARVLVVLRTTKNHAVIEVSDNGPGLGDMEPEKLFEPLFSTKSFGAGLGLPIVRQIIQQHGGEITIGNATKDEGAKAVMRLPLSNEDSKPNGEGHDQG